MPASLRLLGLNPLGERVLATINDHRLVATKAGLLDEASLPPTRACRANDLAAARMAGTAMASPSISASFGHDPKRALAIWHASPTKSIKYAFDEALTAARAAALLDVWVAGAAGDGFLATHPNFWTACLPLRGATAARGVQIGLASYLVKYVNTHHFKGNFLEVGLLEAADAATRMLPSTSRSLRALRQGSDPSAPQAQIMATWPKPPLRGDDSRRYGVGVERAKFDACVVWVTVSSLAAFGATDLISWWRHFATGAKGWVVFECAVATKHMDALAAMLPTAPARIDLPGYSIWEMGSANSTHTTLDWSAWAPPPVVTACAPQPTPDSYGRVPYRPRSRLRPVEGMAPQRLEAAMHVALAALSSDPDTYVAKALGLTLAELANRLSPEQVDAVAMGLAAAANHRRFVLADETGFGKGRALAALGLAAHRQGLPVVWVTENTDLFEDAWRDLKAVTDAPPLPILLHSSASLRDGSGARVAHSTPTTHAATLASDPTTLVTPALVMTTYASLARGSGADRCEWLSRLLAGRGLVLLDEAHNAAGISGTRSVLGKLLKSAASVVFASATFAAGEHNLGLYLEAMLPSPSLRRLLRHAFLPDSQPLREAITVGMATQGALMRREHPPLPPPAITWITPDAAQTATLEAFSDIWRCLSKASTIVSPQSPWTRFGAPLSRTVRELMMALRLPALIDAVIAAVAAGEKPVIVTDSTWEAPLRAYLSGSSSLPITEEESEESSQSANLSIPRQLATPPLWRDRMAALIDVMAPPSIVLPVSDPNRTLYFDLRTHAIDALARLPATTLSPLDELRRALAAAGIRCGELSGRMLCLEPTTTGWSVAARADPPRTDQVRSFNAGALDAIVLTRAGAAGISLHSSRSFADRRPRVMIEWDMSLSPIARWQFWGRIHRRDQAVQPRYQTLALDTPADRRLLARESGKRDRLSAHLGSTLLRPLDLLSAPGEVLAKEWAWQYPTLAAQLGLPPASAGACPRIERLLARSMVLPTAARTALATRLERGLYLAAPLFHALTPNMATTPSRVLRRMWWWGDPSAPACDPQAGLTGRRLDLVERVFQPPPAPDLANIASAVAKANAAAHQQLDGLRAVLALGAASPASQWLRSHAANLSPGLGLMLTDPTSRRRVPAVSLGLDLPLAISLDADRDLPLSQVALDLWIAGHQHPLRLPLTRLLADRAFIAPGRPLSQKAISPIRAPSTRLVLEGNPLAAAQWGRRCGLGRQTLLLDEVAGERLVWLLPAQVCWKDMAAFPRDLVDARHAYTFLSQHRDGILTAAVPRADVFTLERNHADLRVVFSAHAWERAHHNFVDPSVTGPLRRQPSQDSQVVFRLLPDQILRWLITMENRGTGWRLDSAYLPWYKATSPEAVAGFRQG